MCIQLSNNFYAYLSNAVGLVLEIAGVIGLFNARDIGLKEIEKDKIVQMGMKNDTEADRNLNQGIFEKSLKDKVNEIIDNIANANVINRKIYTKSKVWLCSIIVGSALQFLTTFYFLLQNLCM